MRTARRADSVKPITDALFGSLNVGKGAARFGEQCCELLPFPSNGVAFWIVFIVGGDIARSLDDAIETTQETRRAPGGLNPQIGEPGLRVTQSAPRYRQLIITLHSQVWTISNPRASKQDTADIKQQHRLFNHVAKVAPAPHPLPQRHVGLNPLADADGSRGGDDGRMNIVAAVDRDLSKTLWKRRRYWVVTGLFCLMFIVSALLTFLDPAGTKRGTAKLGFPVYIGLYPLAVAKLAGVGAILWRKWPIVTLFAFAGFLYDVLLALAAHVHEKDFPNGWLAVVGLVLWCAAFAVERDRVRFETSG